MSRLQCWTRTDQTRCLCHEAAGPPDCCSSPPVLQPRCYPFYCPHQAYSSLQMLGHWSRLVVGLLSQIDHTIVSNVIHSATHSHVMQLASPVFTVFCETIRSLASVWKRPLQSHLQSHRQATVSKLGCPIQQSICLPACLSVRLCLSIRLCIYSDLCHSASCLPCPLPPFPPPPDAPACPFFCIVIQLSTPASVHEAAAQSEQATQYLCWVLCTLPLMSHDVSK